MKHEVLLAKIVAVVITLLTLVGIARAGESEEWITALFSRYHAPQELTSIVISVGEKFGIDPKVIAAIIVVESSVRPRAVSKGGDYGLMQIRWKVHQKDIQRRFPAVKSAEGLLDPYTNVYIGTEIFARYASQRNTLRGALLRYSGGNKTMAERVLRLLK